MADRADSPTGQSQTRGAHYPGCLGQHLCFILDVSCKSLTSPICLLPCSFSYGSTGAFATSGLSCRAPPPRASECGSRCPLQGTPISLLGLRYRGMLPIGSLTSLPPAAQAALNHAFNNFITLDRGVVRAKNDRTLEARAAYFSTWLTRNGYSHESLASLSPGAAIATLGLFLLSVATGDNIQQRSHLCPKSLAGYLKAAATYLEDRTNQSIPVYMDHHHKTLHPFLAEVLNQRAAWREPSAKKEPLTSDILHHMHQSITATYQQDISSFLDKSAALFDWTRLGIHTGSRLGEYGQSTLAGSHPLQFATVPNSHDAGIWQGSPLAFMASDFTFFDVNGVQLEGPALLTHQPTVRAAAVHIRFRFDKSPTNFTIRKFSRLPGCYLCPVKACLSILHRASKLGIPKNHPLGAYRSSPAGGYRYITGSDISTFMRQTCITVYPNPNHYLRLHVKRLMAHSLRVTACVALHFAGVSAEDIAFRLRWNVDSVKFYLRDCSCDVGSYIKQAVLGAYKV